MNNAHIPSIFSKATLTKSSLIKLAIGSLLALSVFSCSSQPAQESQFYLLNKVEPPVKTTSENHANHSNQPAKAFTLQIHLPDYLQKPNLVMQVHEHQLHYAQFARWAEDLQDGIRKTLTDDLAKANIILTGDVQTFAPQNRLVLEVEHFYPTDEGKVILSGKYWVVAFKDPNNINKHEFLFEEKLEKDGYEQAVVQMRSLLGKLGEELKGSL